MGTAIVACVSQLSRTIGKRNDSATSGWGVNVPGRGRRHDDGARADAGRREVAEARVARLEPEAREEARPLSFRALARRLRRLGGGFGLVARLGGADRDLLGGDATRDRGIDLCGTSHRRVRVVRRRRVWRLRLRLRPARHEAQLKWQRFRRPSAAAAQSRAALATRASAQPPRLCRSSHKRPPGMAFRRALRSGETGRSVTDALFYFAFSRDPDEKHGTIAATLSPPAPSLRRGEARSERGSRRTSRT